MSDIKHTHGLQLLSATRVSVTNHNPNEHSISVNGRQLSYADINLGALKLTDNKTYTWTRATASTTRYCTPIPILLFSLKRRMTRAHQSGAKSKQVKSSHLVTIFSNSNRQLRLHT